MESPGGGVQQLFFTTFASKLGLEFQKEIKIGGWGQTFGHKVPKIRRQMHRFRKL